MFKGFKKGVDDARSSTAKAKASTERDPEKRRQLLEKAAQDHEKRALEYRSKAGGMGGKKWLRMAEAEDARALQARRQIEGAARNKAAASNLTADPSVALSELEDEFSRGKLDKKTFERRRAALQRQIERASA